jgi:hypothetical protein
MTPDTNRIKTEVAEIIFGKQSKGITDLFGSPIRITMVENDAEGFRLHFHRIGIRLDVVESIKRLEHVRDSAQSGIDALEQVRDSAEVKP